MNGLGAGLVLLWWIGTCSVAVDITDVDDYDPGTCDKSNVLQVYAVLDRNDEKKLWICSDESGKYVWKPVDGEVSLGEFLSPGYDCTDILNNEEDAPDGFYWIQLGVTEKRKVWCDMKTDGGGFMLVARKHDAITWDIPSKDEVVHPNSTETFWTSQLGDAPILDFRVQLANNDSFDDTKAHWSFRLKNKRALENLLITEHGCSSLEPGIGDIAYVKDLQTETIASTTFECSVFGGLQSTGKIGWAKMNECLKKPCSGSGYFYHNGKPLLALDHTGVFSYSASGRSSGLGNNATASLGCVNKVCCGCYGPVGGKADYCDSECNTANGGTIIGARNVYSWFWVRTSSPKRIWSKCMEYQSDDENGQLQWYSLVGDSVLPEKGRCSNPGELRLNSGVVVAPDSATAEKVPKVSGILEYRLDKEKLFLRANKTWKSLADEMEVKSRLTQLEKIVDERLKELTAKMNVTDADLKVQDTNAKIEKLQTNITKLEETNADLQRKIDAQHTELEGKIEEGEAELKQNLSQAIPNYDTLVELGETHSGCVNYQWLTDAGRYYGYRNTNSYKCDSHLNGWYRFGGGAGTRMYTGCRSSTGYCHTYYPGYLSGSHPSVDDGVVSRTVCFYYSGSCCGYYSKSIKVINCAGLYYVYELNGTPGCSMRYCSTT